jgi:hypothetical protein
MQTFQKRTFLTFSYQISHLCRSHLHLCQRRDEMPLKDEMPQRWNLQRWEMRYATHILCYAYLISHLQRLGRPKGSESPTASLPLNLCQRWDLPSLIISVASPPLTGRCHLSEISGRDREQRWDAKAETRWDETQRQRQRSPPKGDGRDRDLWHLCRDETESRDEMQRRDEICYAYLI